MGSLQYLETGRENAELGCGYMHFKGQKIYEIIKKCIFFMHKNIHRNKLETHTQKQHGTGWIIWMH